MKSYPYVPSMVQAITVLTVLKMMTKAQTSCGSSNMNGKVMYERLPNTQLQGFDDDIYRDTAPPFMVLEKCQDLCLRDRSSSNIVRTCTSFDFQPGSRIATYNGGPEYEESTCYLTREQAAPEGIGNLMLVPNSVHFTEVCITAPRPDRECPNRRYIFERHPRKKLKLPSADLKEITASNRSECEDKCLSEFSFVCRSATFDSVMRTCTLSRFTRRTHPELLEDDPSSDYLENTCLSAERRCDGLAVFIKEENKRLGGPFEVDLFTNITLEECQAMCVRAEKYFCRSVEYDEMIKQCTLSEEDSISQKDDLGVSSSPSHHFYDFACLDSPRGSEYPDNSVTSHLFTGKRPDTAFQRYRNSRLGGEHHSEISGRSLSECLDECLRQPSFQCRSAVYSERYRTCRLSRYNQRDGMRIIYDADYDYYENLMHQAVGGDMDGTGQRPSDGTGGDRYPGTPSRPSRPGGGDRYHPSSGGGGGRYPPSGGRYSPGPPSDWYPPDDRRYPGGGERYPWDRFPPSSSGGDGYDDRLPSGPSRHPFPPGQRYPSDYPRDRYPHERLPDLYPVTSPDGYPGLGTRYPVGPPPPDRHRNKYDDRYGDNRIGGGDDRYDSRYGGGGETDRYPYDGYRRDRYPPGGDRYAPGERYPFGGDRYTPGDRYQPGEGYIPGDRYTPGARYPSRDRDRYPSGDRDRYPPPVDRDRYPSGDRNRYPSGDSDRYPAGDRGRYPSGDRDRYPSAGDRGRYPSGDRDRYPSAGDRDRYPSAGDRDRYPSSGDRDRYPSGDRYDGIGGFQYYPSNDENRNVGNRDPYDRHRYSYYGDEQSGGSRWFFRPNRGPSRRPGRPIDGYPQGGDRRPFDVGGRPYSPGPDGPIYDNNNIGGGGHPSRPYFSRCEEGDDFKQIGTKQRMRRDFVLRFLTTPSLQDCQHACLEARDFVCRSFNFREGPPLYEDTRENCELSDRDTRDLEIGNPQFFENTGNFDFYERSLGRQGVDGECLDVSQVCNEDGMEFTLRTPEGFYGRIYTYGYYDRCFFRGNGGTVNVLRISASQGYPECGTQRYGDTMTNIVVVQFSDYVQTGKDKRFNLTCLFRGPGEAIVSSGFIGAGSGSPIPIEYLPAENTLSSKVRLLILYQGRPTTTIAVGDPLTFRLEAQEGYNYITDIFATNVVARDPYSGRSVQLIDRFGCPVDSYVFPELDRGRSGDTLEANFNAFKIPESNYLVFEATVRTCRDGCQPAYCQSGSGRQEPSFGRRKRDVNQTLVSENGTLVDSNNLDSSNHTSLAIDSIQESIENDKDNEAPEYVREMIEVFESREELQQEARRAIPVSETVCITPHQYQGLISVIIALALILITVCLISIYVYRRYWSTMKKNLLADQTSSHLSSSYPTRSSGLSGITIFGTGLRRPFSGLGQKRAFSTLSDSVDCPQTAPGGPFEDPSEPIYTDPSLFERSRSLRSIAVSQKRHLSPKRQH